MEGELCTVSELGHTSGPGSNACEKHAFFRAEDLIEVFDPLEVVLLDAVLLPEVVLEVHGLVERVPADVALEPLRAVPLVEQPVVPGGRAQVGHDLAADEALALSGRQLGHALVGRGRDPAAAAAAAHSGEGGGSCKSSGGLRPCANGERQTGELVNWSELVSRKNRMEDDGRGQTTGMNDERRPSHRGEFIASEKSVLVKLRNMLFLSF